MKVPFGKHLRLFLPWLVGGSVAAYLLYGGNVPRQAAFMTGIFLLAALLWATEALPLFVTALLVVGLQILLLANPGEWPGLGFLAGDSPDFQEVFSWALDPVLVLFLGGFLLAQGAVKTGLDQALSTWMLRQFGQRPQGLLLGVMGATALFSMWMSNTATTAMMLALVAPLISQLPKGEPFRRALFLSVPFAANVGGIATPVSSPPNAVALGFLRKAGHAIGFLEWMLVAVPFMLGMLFFSWLLLRYFFKTGSLRLTGRLPSLPLTRQSWFVLATFFITALLWMSDKWHGLPPSVVAIFPAVALTAGGVLDSQDWKRLDWDVLILIGGGVALGAGMQRSGLDEILAQWLPMAGDRPILLTAILVGSTFVFSAFMSNTAAANLLLPIGISSALALGPGGDGWVIPIAISIALTASLSMALPISTPPNALAYAKGKFARKEMAILGGSIGVLGAILIILFCAPVLKFWGIARP